MEFPNQIVEALVISNDAGGTAVQIGPGPNATFFGPTTTMSLQFEPSTGSPELVFWPNSDPTKRSRFFLDASTHVTFAYSIPMTSPQTGNTVQAALYLGPAGGTDPLGELTFFNTSTRADEGASVQVFSNHANVFSQIETGRDTYLQLNGNSSHSAYLNLDNSLTVPGFIFDFEAGMPTIALIGEGWRTDVTYSTGFSSDPTFPFAFRRMPTGQVQFRGRIAASGAVTTNQQAALLPSSAYFPAQQFNCVIDQFGATTLQKLALTTDGRIEIGVATSAAATFSLDNVIYSVI